MSPGKCPRRDPSGGTSSGGMASGREKGIKERRGNDLQIITPFLLVPSGDRLFPLRTLDYLLFPPLSPLSSLLFSFPSLPPSSLVASHLAPRSLSHSQLSTLFRAPSSSCLQPDLYFPTLPGSVPATNSCGRRARDGARVCPSRCRLPPLRAHRTECSGSSPSWRP